MDRRHFLAASSLAAASPLLAATPADAPRPPTPPVSEAALFRTVKLGTDGLALDPREYSALLAESAGDLAMDNYSLGGLVEQVEAKFATLLGKEKAVFLPTGTLANQLAVRTLAGDDRRVLVQAESHLYNDSGDAATTLSGLTLVPLATGAATMTLSEVREWLDRSAGGRVATPVGVISIESPVRRRGHEHVDFEETERVCALARERGVRLHLDGARLFNVPHHDGRPVKRIAALFDTVYVSLWKHFNAGSGAILAGDAATLDGLYHARRMFGGGLPQAWPLLAPVLKYADTYERDYAQAWAVADAVFAALQADGRFRVEKLPHGTSLVRLIADGLDAEKLTAALADRGVRLPMRGADGAHPVQVNATWLRKPAAEITAAFLAAADAAG